MWDFSCLTANSSKKKLGYMKKQNTITIETQNVKIIFSPNGFDLNCHRTALQMKQICRKVQIVGL